MRLPSFLRLVVLLFPVFVSAAPPGAASRAIPAPLVPWEGWATWDDEHRLCPTPFNTAGTPLCFWPSRLNLSVDGNGGRWDLTVTVFSDSWVPLPGGKDVWPVDVLRDGVLLPVLEHDGRPCVQLPPGTARLQGGFRWGEIPRGVPLPQEIGILSLTLDGEPVAAPMWDDKGFLWLKRNASTEEADKDFLSVKVYALIEDGIPLWLHTQVELIVSGKSREEDIGSILPEGWKLASVDSPLPVLVDDAGRMKAQVRAGKWTITANAFRLDNPTEFRFAATAQPAASEELVAFRAKPDFRMVEITGSPSIDVSQTTFPAMWREFPVYRWDTATPFRMDERMRGMGLQAPRGLSIERSLWLDDDGGGFTFRDRITGSMQQIWRLDAAEGQILGSVRSRGQGQLITRNPDNGAPGVEIRTRNLNLEATGRTERTGTLSATGWRADAESLSVTLNLPPGWRLFALFGADAVEGDWLTAWSLLDLFLLLIFSLAVFRLWGLVPAIVAFFAFALSYHEPGAPRFIWLALIIPLALLKVVPPGWGHRLVLVAKWVMIVVFLLIAVPFLSQQVQQALFPQLEDVGPRAVPVSLRQTADSGVLAVESETRAEPAAPAPNQRVAEKKAYSGGWGKGAQSYGDSSNLLYDAKARIQTGPGVPDWTWRTVSFRWFGPVSTSQQVRPLLISGGLERFLTVLRILLLLGLAAILLGARRWSCAVFRRSGPVALGVALLALAPTGSQAEEIPDSETLATLRERLLKPSDAYPNAADIASVALSVRDGAMRMEAEIHAALPVAVPLPGQLPEWSPVSVVVDGKPEPALRRGDGYLWVVVPAGVHRVQVDGRLSPATEWEWAFLLKPRRVTIDAPGWTVSGVRADGVPDQQVFFVQQEKTTAGQDRYDRQDYQTLVQVDRRLELGLVWQVRTTVLRLSSPGKAIALRVPLLPGENVLTPNTVCKDGFIEVRLGAQDRSFSWESELSVAKTLTLATQPTDTWVERWNLVASPVWNVTIAGLPPVFSPGDPELVPVWHPWPGERVDLSISRPEALPGATVTVSEGTQRIQLGQRQRTVSLALTLRCSLGEDFLVGLPAGAEVTGLTFDGSQIPVRKDGDRVIIPLRPGEQKLTLDWKSNTPLGFHARAEQVTLPVESANIRTEMTVPPDRWVLWTDGPLLGPAVRFWTVLVCCFLAAWALGRIALSPLRPIAWMLLSLGLTQVPLGAALIVVAWLFFLAWRGRDSFLRLPVLGFNALQVALILVTGASLCIFIAVVCQGLLGNPEMFIAGNHSSLSQLNWYQARCGTALPTPGCYSVSLWWFRILMLAWALWLAASLLRWLQWGWEQFRTGGYFRRNTKPAATPPPLDAQN